MTVISLLLGIAILYTLGGLITWWVHFGRFDESDVVAMFWADPGTSHLPTMDAKTVYQLIVGTTYMTWPIAVAKLVYYRVVFDPVQLQKEYVLVQRALSTQGLSMRMREWLVRSARVLERRFAARGLTLPPPEDSGG